MRHRTKWGKKQNEVVPVTLYYLLRGLISIWRLCKAMKEI